MDNHEKYDIPKEFELMGVTWTVIFDNKKPNDSNAAGICEFNRSVITIGTKNEYGKYSADQIKTSFYHELTHAILDTLHERKLSSNEKLVEGIGALIWQFVKTKK